MYEVPTDETSTGGRRLGICWSVFGLFGKSFFVAFKKYSFSKEIPFSSPEDIAKNNKTLIDLKNKVYREKTNH